VRQLGLALLAIAPALCLAYIAVRRVLPERPPGDLFMFVALGAGAAIPVAILQPILGDMLEPGGVLLPRIGVLVLWALCGVALLEEGCKRLFLHMRLHHDRSIITPLDYVVAATAVALGYALAENTWYTLQHGATIAFIRLLTSVPAHALTGVVMGWRLARASALTGRSDKEGWLAILEPTIWHFTYDMPLLLLRETRLQILHVVLVALWGSILVLQGRVCYVRLRNIQSGR
jgi:RsiW-degrading membrane proteinase PrsW (M82 family)